MRYFEQIDENLVTEVIGGFLQEFWNVHIFLVRKKDDCFKVTYKIGENYRRSIFVRDFDVDFGSKHMLCSSLNKKWQIAMAKIFGVKYLIDLEKYLYKDFDKKSEKQQKEIVGSYMEVLVKAKKTVKFNNVTKEQ